MKSTRSLIALLASAMLIVVAAYPRVHNDYLHPLVRLANSISGGDDCDKLRERFVHYVLKEGSPAAQQNETTTTRDLGDVADFLPKLTPVLLAESHHARFWFLGTAVLKLYRDSEENTAYAEIELVSTRTRSVRRVRRLERRFRTFLSDPKVEFVEVERYAAETADSAESDWCLLERRIPDGPWEIRCESD